MMCQIGEENIFRDLGGYRHYTTEKSLNPCVVSQVAVVATVFTL